MTVTIQSGSVQYYDGSPTEPKTRIGVYVGEVVITEHWVYVTVGVEAFFAIPRHQIRSVSGALKKTVVT